jgi:hypothetical protein
MSKLYCLKSSAALAGIVLQLALSGPSWGADLFLGPPPEDQFFEENRTPDYDERSGNGYDEYGELPLRPERPVGLAWEEEEIRPPRPIGRDDCQVTTRIIETPGEVRRVTVHRCFRPPERRTLW